MTEPAVRLRDLRKTFGSGSDAVHAVDGVDLDILDGEFLTLLGPSGSGKTTVLRMIAGFELPTGGSIVLDGADVTRRAPVRAQRQHGLPGLRALPAHDRPAERRVRPEGQGRRQGRAARPGRRRRSTACGSGSTAPASRRSCPAASASASRWPGPWSTGPRCCCSTSRSAPSTSSCASRCRSSSRGSSARSGITFVFVTHDQEEALTMSDRIAVFNAGRIEQVGSPAEVYERPATPFVAGFVGTSNLLEGEAARTRARPGRRLLRTAGEDPAGRPGRAGRRPDEHSALGHGPRGRLRRVGDAVPRRPRRRRHPHGAAAEPRRRRRWTSWPSASRGCAWCGTASTSSGWLSRSRLGPRGRPEPRRPRATAQGETGSDR